MDSKCVCGEHGQGSHNCPVFCHGPQYDDTSWADHEEQRDLKLVEQAISVNSKGEFYFWDETGSEAHGPYKTVEDARGAQVAYADTI
jgi:hypothetical protein